MKAFLLAAGLGTRLRPLTNDIPKCLVPVNGKPLLAYWIELLEKHGVTEVLINLHHQADQVRRFIKHYELQKINFHLYEEPELLGSGGTLRENKDFVKNEEDFFILYADNLTNMNLGELLVYHRLKKQPLTMALNRVADPKRCGIATLNKNGIVTSFVEKPENPAGNLANTGVYVAKPEVLELLPKKKITDLGYDLLPHLTGKMAGWETSDYLIDIGTLKNLHRAENEWILITSQ